MNIRSRAKRMSLFGLIALAAVGCETTVLPGGGGVPSGKEATVTGPRLLVKTWARFLTFPRTGPLEGVVEPASIMSGDKTTLGTYGDIVVTASNQVIVTEANYGSLGVPARGELLVFADSTKMGGNQAPVRTVTGDNTKLGKSQAYALALDRAADQLYVGVQGSEGGFPVYLVLVFNNVSSDAFNGDVAPARVLRSVNWGGLSALFVANNMLFFSGGSDVIAYTNASSLNGEVATARLPGYLGTGKTESIFIDAANRLYATGGFGNSPTQVLRFDNASSISYDPTTQTRPAPSATFTMPDGLFPRSVAVDSNGTGYVCEEGHSGAGVPAGIYIFDNMATSAGSATPSRLLKWVGSDGSSVNPPAAVLPLD